MKTKLFLLMVLPVFGSALFGFAAEDPQGPPPPPPPPNAGGPPPQSAGGPPPHGRWEGGPPMHRPMGGPPGRWWTNPELVQKLGLSQDQQKRIDAAFQQNRLKLIDMNASLQKAEAELEPMLEADHPDETRVLQQIDRIAQARAELEKTNARMLLAFRSVLTTDQWKKLQAEQPQHRENNPRPRPNQR